MTAMFLELGALIDDIDTAEREPPWDQRNMPQRESVRRTDVRFRAEHPHITTRIFEIDPHKHVIFVPLEQLDVSKHQERFGRSIRQVADNVTLSNTIPEHAAEISGRRDAELGKDTIGLPLTVADLAAVFAGRFPLAPALVRAERSGPATLKVDFSESLPQDLMRPVQTFLSHQFPEYEVLIGVQPAEVRANSVPKGGSAEALAFSPINTRRGVPDFVADDEQWWFENLGGLFEGSISPGSFEIARDTGFSCYIHGTSFPNIDLRQALMAYDTIFLEPPFSRQGQDDPFWKSQNISPPDLLRLIEVGRLRLVHVQPEERSDLGFLREAYETNPNGVFSRRRLAGLAIADMVETANEYVLGRANLQDAIRSVIVTMAEGLNSNPQELAKSILYPTYLRRSALLPFLRLGAMGLMGINQGSLFAEAYKRANGKDVMLEADMFGQSIHLAHVLNATYIPHTPHTDYVGSWLAPMQLLGDRLNFFRSFNTRIAATWAANERRKLEKRAVVLPPVPVLKFDKHVTLEHVLSFTSHPSDRRRARSLIGRLANLPDEERHREVERLQQELFDLDISRHRRENKMQWLDAGSGAAAYALGVNLPPFFAGVFLLERLVKAARTIPRMGGLIDAIEEALSPPIQPNEDLHLLSKISRVATLRD
jgi:hypothetical protein